LLAAREALTNPDRTEVVNILRHSEESTVPPVQRPPAPAAPPPSPPWSPGPPAPNPPRPQPQWTGPPPQFAGPAPFGPGHPPVPPRKRNPWVIVAGAAAAVVVLVAAAIGISMAVGNDDSETPTAASTTSTTTTRSTTRTTPRTTSPSPSTPPPGAANRLLGLLPAGYPPGTCAPDPQPMAGAIVSVSCGPNTDANGPTISSYALFPDLQSVQGAFTEFTGTDTIVKCPGDKASPGTWWHNKDPNTVLGQIACGHYKGDQPKVLWTNQQTLVFAVVGGDSTQGPNLDQLYKWWAAHS